MRPTILALPLLFLLARCSAPETDPIVGPWQAFGLEEEGRPMEVRLEEIRFHFFADGTYRFESTLNQREAGRYDRRKDRLVTQDTLQTGAEGKVVRISRLEADTMVLEMNHQGKERILSLVRTPAPGR